MHAMNNFSITCITASMKRLANRLIVWPLCA